ncbi:MAG: sigma-54-dependent transcriptional regulator [Planctomycetota bacterium]|jgi:two-component system NtrC family response regulator
MSVDAVVLVVEDDPSQREQLAAFLESLSVTVLEAGDVPQAREALTEASVDVVVTDLRLPGESGLDLLRGCRAENPLVDFIMVTAHGSVETAVEAMREGAYDFLTKPVDLDVLELRIRRLLERRRLAREVRELRDRIRDRIDVEGLVAESGSMQEVLAVVRRVAPTDSTVLLTGESGTGKERIAELVHGQSPRRNGPFVRVNCAALPETLLETELFGHRRGAFTGAHQDRRGRFDEADGGTLLLDEIGELGLSTQAKLLRALQEREIVRLGDNQPRPVDVRILAATNRDLDEEIRAGRFREDLYYRIQVITIRVPPLRERPQDVVAMIPVFLDRFSQEAGVEPRRVSREAHDLLVRYDYPGNVRELMNVLQRAVILSSGRQIRVEDLAEQVRRPPEPESRLETLPGETLPELVEEIERRSIRRALREEGGVKARAARALGLPERVLRYKMNKYGIEPTKSSDT